MGARRGYVDRYAEHLRSDTGARVRVVSEEGMSPDRVHPNDEGYAEIADRLRELGYEPLGPR